MLIPLAFGGCEVEGGLGVGRSDSAARKCSPHFSHPPEATAHEGRCECPERYE